MKKLMTMIAAVATAFGLYAADSGTSFEGSTGKLSEVWGSLDELAGGAPASGTWEFDKDGTAEVKAYGTDAKYSQTDRSEKFKDQLGDYKANVNYLALSSGTNLLKRNYAFNALNKNLYFDSVVKMTAFDADPEITDAKLAVWLRDTSDDKGVAPATNLMVTVAGENYNCGNRPDLFETWARVTIKALAINEEKIGFVVYVDKNVVTCDDLSYTGVTLNDNAQEYANAHALFIPNTSETTIAYAGFAGIGSIDDLVFTETAPAFAADYTFKKVAWYAGVTGFTCTNDQGIAFTTNDLTAAGSVTFQYTGELPAVNAASVTYAAGKMANEITVIEGVETIKSQDAGAIVTINAVNTPYASANAAITAINGMGEVAATLKLQAAESAGFELNNDSATIVLDLAGKTIKGKDEVIKVTAGTLTITNSTDELGKVVATADGGVAVKAKNDDYISYITAGQFDGKIDCTQDALTISGGKFLASANAGLAEKATIDPADKTLIADPNDATYLIVGVEAPKTGTVIFICEATGLNQRNENLQIGATIEFPTVEGETTIAKGWFKEATFETPADTEVQAGENTYYAKVVDAVAKVGTEKFETAGAAFAAVQALEKAGTYPITVTALVANLAVTDPSTAETITLGQNAVITIEATRWTFEGTVSGTVTLAAGKSIKVPEGSPLTVKAPAGDYKVVTTPGEGVVTYTVVAIQYATLTVATVENLTISVTNAAGEVQNTGAKFDKDLATVLYVTRTPASGYELDGYVATETITMSADVTVTGAVKSAAQPVNPGEEKQYDDPQKAADAAKAINDNKEASINVPPEAADNKTAYLARVAAKVIEGNKVVVDIAAENEATFKGELDTEMKKTAVAAALTDATATKATIATVPGFYYWIEGGVEVGTINQNGAPKIGTGSTVELTKPTLEAAATAGKAFYKLAVGVKAP